MGLDVVPGGAYRRLHEHFDFRSAPAGAPRRQSVLHRPRTALGLAAAALVGFGGVRGDNRQALTRAA